MAIYLLHGDERYLLEQTLKNLRDTLVPPEWRAFSYQRLQAPKLGELVETLSTVRMALGGDSLLEVTHCGALSKAVKEGHEEQALKRLLELLPNLEDGRHVVFVTDKLDKKLKLPKWLTTPANGVKVQGFEVPPFWKGEQAEQNLMMACTQAGLALQPQAAALLVESYGNALELLMSEAQKLALLSDNTTITAALVKEHSQLAEGSFAVFEDWLLEKNAAFRMQSLQHLLRGESAAGLFLRFRQLLEGLVRLRLLRQQGLEYEAIAQQLGKKPYALKMQDATFKPVASPRLWGLFTLASQLEERFKTGLLTDAVALELLLCR